MPLQLSQDSFRLQELSPSLPFRPFYDLRVVSDPPCSLDRSDVAETIVVPETCTISNVGSAILREKNARSDVILQRLA